MIARLASTGCYTLNRISMRQKQNFVDNLLIDSATCVKRMTRHVKTGAGVSDVSYENKEGQPRLTGELQCKADVPAFFYQQSSVLLRVHNEIAPCLHLASSTRKRNITHNNISYSDDNDSHVSAPMTTMIRSDVWWPG